MLQRDWEFACNTDKGNVRSLKAQNTVFATLNGIAVLACPQVARLPTSAPCEAFGAFEQRTKKSISKHTFY